jgi:hypothetical protein
MAYRHWKDHRNKRIYNYSNPVLSPAEPSPIPEYTDRSTAEHPISMDGIYRTDVPQVVPDTNTNTRSLIAL